MDAEAPVPAADGPSGQPWERTCDAILWTGGRIAIVGSTGAVRAEARRRGIEPEDLDGRVVVPGFVDAHTHFLHVGVKRTRPDLRGAASRAECLRRVAGFLKAHPGDRPVIAEGWDESGWSDPTPPSREDVDALVEGAAPGSHRPVVLRRICGHIAVAGTAALAFVRQRWPDGRAADPRTGILLEEASLYLNEVFPATPRELDHALLAAMEEAHRLGVTAVGDYSQAPYRAALQRAAAAGRLTVRVASSIYVQQLEDEARRRFRTGRPGTAPWDVHRVPSPGTHEGVDPGAGGGSSPWLRDGGLKVFLDGSLGAHTAALREPYFGAAHPHPHGRLNWSRDQVEGFFRRADGAGVQLHAHAIGDAAIDQALDAFEAVAARPQLRHRIEHFEIVHDSQVKRAARLGIVASSQPNFVGTWSAKGGMYEERLGGRFLLNNRFQSFLGQGLRVAFGSDGMPFGPLPGIAAAVGHPDPAQRMGAAQAAWHYTREGAWSLHWEDAIGSLRAGHWADLVILEGRDLAGDPAGWSIHQTVTAGMARHTSSPAKVLPLPPGS